MTREILARDETLRDGNQGEAPRSAFRAVEHVITMAPYCDMMSIGWIYTNPTDIECARYLREHGAEMAKRQPNFNTDKLFVYTLVHRGREQAPDEVSEYIPFGKMLRDLKSGKQPYGTVNILAKARVSDLKDFGADVTSESFQRDILNTMHLIKQANPNVQMEIALEHFYTAWLESENQVANHAHIVNTLATALLEGAVRITAPDTDGAHTPEEIGQVLREVTAALQQDQRLLDKDIHFNPTMFIAHMHDDLGHATANTKAALEAGAGAFDSTVGKMGERMGNVTLDDFIKQLTGDTRFTAYQHALQKVLGLSPDDKMVGSAQAFCGTGGMHADHALKELWKFIDGNKGGYDEFVKQYSGSYASVPPKRFGQKLQMTLSPVAGAANVLFMLAGLGMDLREKKNSRIAEVLEEIKEGEHQRAVNYRGYNNTNAFLLLAEKFGLRDYSDNAGDKTRNQLTIAPSKQPHGRETVLLDLTMQSGGNTLVNAALHYTPDATASALLKHGDDHDPHQDGAALLKVVARNLLQQSKKSLATLDKRFDQLELKDLRVLEGPVGRVRPENGDVLRPEPEKVRAAVKLIFTAGSSESFQANGSGSTYEEALGMAIQTMLDYQSFQIEQDKLKAKQSPILETPLADTHAETQIHRRASDGGSNYLS